MTDGALRVRDILRIREYRRLLAAQAVSDIGDGITLLLVLLVINHLTGSPGAVALMAIVEAVPAFTVGLVAGVYVDRWNRRTVILAADALRAIIVPLFAIAATLEMLPLLYVLGFVQASVATFFRPARGAMLPRLVSRGGLPAANALAQASQVIGSVVGAGIAGLVFSSGGSGAAGFAISAMTFVVSFAFVLGVPSEAGCVPTDVDEQVDRRESVRAAMLEGLRMVRGSRALCGSLIAAAVSMLGLGAVNVLFVPLLVNDLKVDPAWMAGIEFAQTSAMILAAGALAALPRGTRPTTVVTVTLAGIGVCIGLLAGVTAVWQVVAVLFAVGWMVTPLQAMLQTITQTAATDAARGRVVSLFQASLSTANVASMAAGGALGALIGIRVVYAAAAAIVMLASGIAFVLFRPVARFSAPAKHCRPT